MRADKAPSSGKDSNSASAISISVFFPCYNEQSNVAPVVERACSVLDELDADYEVIIVNDGSSDETGRIADEIAAKNAAVRVVHHPKNRGYGAALQSGFKTASKDIIFYTDGDGQFDIAEMPPLLGLLDAYDIVSCYRLDRKDSIMRRINAWCWTKLVCLVFGLRLRDIDCAFKLYRAEIFNGMELCSTGALIDAEVLARASRRGYSIVQRGVHHFPRTAGKQTGANPRVIMRAFAELFKLRKKISNER